MSISVPQKLVQRLGWGPRAPAQPQQQTGQHQQGTSGNQLQAPHRAPQLSGVGGGCKASGDNGSYSMLEKQ
jgi:hypothetical protein